jgi:hypothetical protein
VEVAEHWNLEETCTTEAVQCHQLIVTLSTLLCAIGVPDVRHQSLNVILYDLRVLSFWICGVKLCHWLRGSQCLKGDTSSEMCGNANPVMRLHKILDYVSLNKPRSYLRFINPVYRGAANVTIDLVVCIDYV